MTYCTSTTCRYRFNIQEELETMKISNEMGDSKECEPITLSKKYNDIEEIERDSQGDSQIFFDRKYDDTPYDIGNAWLEEHSLKLQITNHKKLF